MTRERERSAGGAGVSDTAVTWVGRGGAVGVAGFGAGAAAGAGGAVRSATGASVGAGFAATG